jgi:uncharacterized protein (DUF1015 family)
MVRGGLLVRDPRPSYYVYRLTWRCHVETGLAAAASVADYDTNRIRKHEFTTVAKEDDRVRQIEAVNAQTGPVMLAYPKAPDVDALLQGGAAGAPDFDVTADDGVRHEMWPVTDAATITAITSAVDALPALYIADGHHRSAAASRIAATRRGSEPAQHFLAVLFPHHEMTILDYNRLMRDLNGRSAEKLVEEIGQRFAVARSAVPVKPAASGQFGMFLAGQWYRLAIKQALVPYDDPLGRLPVTLLHKNLIEPLFGVTDPRRDKRIDFVGGARGLEELERRVRSDEMAAAFSLHPTEMTDLMAVADAGEVMPPKSTWFEPKLADGVVSHVLD